jgi:hypothetical protein
MYILSTESGYSFIELSDMRLLEYNGCATDATRY